ncbi:hypothetical protein C8Q75DRAFT_804481 [Abortiporus biennis]|nr:hypothetical protein C8Q75DRAFT_804481 [Abortiporus biennis]
MNINPGFKLAEYSIDNPPPLASRRDRIPTCVFGYGFSYKYLEYLAWKLDIFRGPKGNLPQPPEPAYDEPDSEPHLCTVGMMVARYMWHKSGGIGTRFSESSNGVRLVVFSTRGATNDEDSLKRALDPNEIQKLKERLGIEDVEPRWYISYPV